MTRRVYRIQFKTRAQGALCHPVFVIGQNPGRPGKSQPHLTWTGPRGASLVQRAANGLENVYFTNVFNWYVYPKTDLDRYVRHGIRRLKADLTRHDPYKIVCLGAFASKVVGSLNLYETTIISFPHPSYAYRFKKNHDEYVQTLRKALS